MKALRPLLVIFIILLLDQTLKFAIKLNYYYQEGHSVLGSWQGFQLYFIENEGMAFGLKIGGESGKLTLSIFRMFAVGVIGYLLSNMVKKNAAKGLIVSMSMIFAGALGNIIDSVFYGVIFSESSASQLATLFPDGGGYAGWLHGRVVDMLYFPLADGVLPSWIPIVGGDYFVFFRPIFNIADASITTGVISIVVFQKKFFPPKKKMESDQSIPAPGE